MIKLKPEDGTFAPGGWSNGDLDPTPPEQRTWRTYNYVTYWLCDAVAPGNLRLGSSLVALGLSWKSTLGIIALGHFLISLAITANRRASFGFYFSYVVVVVRLVVGFFWYGINTYTGAECVHAVLVAIWPSFQNVPNHLPKSANITTQMMTAYIIYFIIILPFHYIHPRDLRWFFTFKSILCPPAIFGMLAWACSATNGGLHTPIFHQGDTVTGSAYAWAFLNGPNAMLGNYGTLAVNINVFTRYARNSRMTYVQIIIIPLSFMLMAFWGIIIAGAADQIYEKEYGIHSPFSFCGLAFVLAQMGTNLSANCVSASNDLNALFPAYINLRRGSFLIAFIGAWALTPWNILSSAESLLNFMSGYINWRAVLSWFVGWVPLIPGFAQSVKLLSRLIHRKWNASPYYLGYLYGFFVSFTMYTGLSLVFPPKSTFITCRLDSEGSENRM
ncbi:permease for cytosine/purines, uracil, thiamine, allantoin-domain-containing protein [Delphinella strobiligena]|nr:permease for cytosine/purines, uracil, thiamine, allantoin-domain-containing protein [Delphinella strobiligena]